MPLALACGPKSPSGSDFARTAAPAPLPPRPFQLTEPARGTLGNGIPVYVVENHETPLVYVQMVFDAGGWTDPPDRPRLASVTLDMMNEGAGPYDALALSAALRKLGSSVDTSASLDASRVAAFSLRERLEPTLDLMGLVLLDPTFPDAEWERARKKRLQDLQASREDPRGIAARVSARVNYGSTYQGNLSSEAGYAAIDPAAMRAWHATHVVPARATLLVGGDTTLAEILPLLEARFGGWTAPAPEPPPRPAADGLPAYEGTVVFLADKPGSPQSVVQAHRFVGSRTDPDYTAFLLANRVMGGQFTSRINMNLREDKGWTYGARAGVDENFLPGLWTVSASVETSHTADAMREILAELRASVTDGGRPIEGRELDDARNGWLGQWPLAFENPGVLLDETAAIRRYGLSEDWIRGFPDRLRAADAASVNAAWRAHVDADDLVFVVVGDEATVRPSIEALGLPIVAVDADGNRTN